MDGASSTNPRPKEQNHTCADSKTLHDFTRTPSTACGCMVSERTHVNIWRPGLQSDPRVCKRHRNLILSTHARYAALTYVGECARKSALTRSLYMLCMLIVRSRRPQAQQRDGRCLRGRSYSHWSTKNYPCFRCFGRARLLIQTPTPTRALAPGPSRCQNRSLVHSVLHLPKRYAQT